MSRARAILAEVRGAELDRAARAARAAELASPLLALSRAEATRADVPRGRFELLHYLREQSPRSDTTATETSVTSRADALRRELSLDSKGSSRPRGP